MAETPETSAPLHQLDVTAGQRHAHLVQRIDDHRRLGAVARRLPVVAAVQAGARIHRVVDTGVANVLPVTHAPRLEVDRLEDVLVQHLGQVDEGPRAPVELPEDGVLAGREQPLVIVDVDQHPLEDDVQVERLARHVLEVPGDLPRARVQGERRVGVEGVVVGRHPAARRHPRLRLGGGR